MILLIFILYYCFLALLVAPKIFYDVQGTNGGLAKYASMSVHFNIKIMLENFDDYLRTTVPHEVCHIGVWQKYLKENKQVSPKAHGAEWKLMMFVVGAPARRTHEYDVDELNYLVLKNEDSCFIGNSPRLLG